MAEPESGEDARRRAEYGGEYTRAEFTAYYRDRAQWWWDQAWPIADTAPGHWATDCYIAQVQIWERCGMSAVLHCANTSTRFRDQIIMALHSGYLTDLSANNFRDHVVEVTNLYVVSALLRFVVVRY